MCRGQPKCRPDAVVALARRQLNVWQTVHAWSGQQFDAHFAGPQGEHSEVAPTKGKLSLQPNPAARSFPVMLPTGFGIVRLSEDDGGSRLERIEWLSGELNVVELRLRGKLVARQVALQAGEVMKF